MMSLRIHAIEMHCLLFHYQNSFQAGCKHAGSMFGRRDKMLIRLDSRCGKLLLTALVLCSSGLRIMIWVIFDNKRTTFLD